MPSPHPRPKKHSAVLRSTLLLLALLLAPWGSAPAAEEPGKPPVQTVGEEVIGIPEPMESRDRCTSGVLLPNKDNFYIVRDGLLSEYQIEPFKRIRSVALEWELLLHAGWGLCRIRSAADHRKVIVYNNNIILLLDAMTGKLLNSKSLPKGIDLWYARVEGNRIFLLVDPDGFLLNETGYQLLVWDLESLEQQKAIELDTVVKTFRPDGEPPRMSVEGGRVYLYSGKHLLILSSKDLHLELSAATAGTVWISPGLNELYFPWSTSIKDVVANREIDLHVPQGQAALFDQKTRSFKSVDRVGDPNNIRDYSMGLRAQGYRPVVSSWNYSMSPEYWGEPKSSISKSSPDRLQYRFHYYPQGEAVVLKYTFKYAGGPRLVGLSLTPGARQYLNMETEEGLLVPINDATLKFYQSGFAGETP